MEKQLNEAMKSRVTSQFVNFPTGVIQVASQPKVTHSALIPRGGLIMTQMRFIRRAKNKPLLNRRIFHALAFWKGVMSVNAWYAVFSVCLFEFTAHIKLHNSGNIFNEEYLKLE